MLAEEAALQRMLRGYYVLSFFFGLISNFLLLYLIKTTKSAMLRDMKYYLFNTAIFNIMVTLSTSLAECRPVANEVTLAVFCYGPCKYFGKQTCFVAFAIVQSSVVAASISILLSFYYRYRLLIVAVNKKYRHAQIFLIFSIFPIASLLFQLLTDANFVKVEAETRRLHPEYDYYENALIGFSNTRSVGAIIANLMIAFGVYVSPFIAVFYRRKIFKILSMNTNQKLPVKYCKKLIDGLLLQTLIPFFVYIPPYSYVLYSQFSGHSNIFLEYGLNIFGSFTAFINPILTCIFVLPYRRALCQKFFTSMSTVSVDDTEMAIFTDNPQQKVFNKIVGTEITQNL